MPCPYQGAALLLPRRNLAHAKGICQGVALLVPKQLAKARPCSCQKKMFVPKESFKAKPCSCQRRNLARAKEFTKAWPCSCQRRNLARAKGTCQGVALLVPRCSLAHTKGISQGLLVPVPRDAPRHVPRRNISSSTDQKLDRIISMMEHLLSSGEVQVNPAMDFSYTYNYGRYEDSHYYNVNGVEEDVSFDTLTNLEVKEDTQMEDYLIDTSEECEVFQIELEIVIALNEEKDEMKIDVNSNKPEMPQIESEEDQPLVLVQPPTLPCTFGTPYKGVEVRERLRIFYTADTFVLDDPDTIDSFVLEVPDELLNLKEDVHASLPKYVDAPFVVHISKGEGIT
ncbi:hypothetical protein Syun_016815 [Stephania yunnanensis]|uniref:Uncharacterized protein n=1 Tax=Stephania yunnanensis TaxID=152371 RepID=A0AAP0P2H9_9MAGN